MSFATTAAVVGSAAAAKAAFDPETGQTTQTQQLDPAQQAMLREVYGQGRALAAQPFVPYTGARVAGFSPDQLRAFQATRGLFETGMQYDPMAGLAGLAQAPAPSLLQTDISAYQSPYTQQVIDTTLGDIRREQDIAQRRAQESAIRAGAFGGSRSAIMEAEATRPYVEQAARTAAGLREAGFSQALGAAESDIARQMATRGFQRGVLGDISSLQAGRLGLLGGIGAQQQMLQQRALDVPYQEFQRALSYGPQQLGLLSAAAGQPFATSKTTGYQPSSLEGALGALDILNQPFMKDLYKKQTPETSTSTTPQGIFNVGGFLGSDERMKEDIKFVGKEKGHNIYTWNWKDEAKQMGWDKFPTIGVLAQEVMKYMPEAVMEDENGYYRVNYGVL